MSNMDFRRSDSLSWWLAGALIALVLAFDLLSIFMPQVAGMDLFPGSAFSIGVVFAFCIVAAVVGAAMYYVRRLNLEDAARQSRSGADRGP